MATAPNIVDLARMLLKQGIHDELVDRGLTPDILKHLDIALIQESGKLRLSFPSNFRTLKLNHADEGAFLAGFNDWVADLVAANGGGTFMVQTGAPTAHGLCQIECTAFTPFDLIRGVNGALGSANQIDASLLGRSK